MDTANFNRLDHVIRWMRARRVRRSVPAGAVVVDVGCGHDMWFLTALGSALRHGYGIDPDVTEPSTATLSAMPVDARTGLASLEAGSVDLVVSLAAIEHFDPAGVPAVLSAARRVLRPGGGIVLTTPTPAAKPVLEFLAFRLGVISRAEVADHRHYYTGAELRRLLDDAGFADVRYRKFQLGFNSTVVARVDPGSATGRMPRSPTP